MAGRALQARDLMINHPSSTVPTLYLNQLRPGSLPKPLDLPRRPEFDPVGRAPGLTSLALVAVPGRRGRSRSPEGQQLTAQTEQPSQTLGEYTNSSLQSPRPPAKRFKPTTSPSPRSGTLTPTATSTTSHSQMNLDLLPTLIPTNGNGNGNGNSSSSSSSSISHSNGLGSDLGQAGVATDEAEYAQGGAGYFKPLWPGSNLDRQEFVRLALQTFKEMGYTLVGSLQLTLQPSQNWLLKLGIDQRAMVVCATRFHLAQIYRRRSRGRVRLQPRNNRRFELPFWRARRFLASSRAALGRVAPGRDRRLGRKPLWSGTNGQPFIRSRPKFRSTGADCALPHPSAKVLGSARAEGDQGWAPDLAQRVDATRVGDALKQAPFLVEVSRGVQRLAPTVKGLLTRLGACSI